MTPHAATANAEPDLAEVELVTVLAALADPVRVEIVRQLAGCPKGVGLTCGQMELPVGKSTQSHHLKVMTAAGLLKSREEGTRKYVSLRSKELEQRFPGLIDLVLAGR